MIRADAICVTRNFLGLVLLPSLPLAVLLMPIVRDLPDVSLAPLRSPLTWLLIALTVAAALAGRHGTMRMTATYLWILVVGTELVVLGGVVFMAVSGLLALPDISDESATDMIGILAVFVIRIAMLLALLYWLLMSPAMQTVLAATIPRRQSGSAPGSRRTRVAAIGYMVAAAASRFRGGVRRSSSGH